MSDPTAKTIVVRPLDPADLLEVARIDATHTGRMNEAYWRGIFADLFRPGRADDSVALAVDGESGLAAYLIGEIRLVEFGSEPTGWIFAISVDRGAARSGIASALLDAARPAFQKIGVTKLRTMVKRTDVPVLSFFRTNGFVGGPYMQLELDLSR